MKKRPTIKGEGADIFLKEIGKKPRLKRGTFYLPSSLLDELDVIYLKFRLKKTKISKSDIVRSCLEKGLVEFRKKLK